MFGTLSLSDLFEQGSNLSVTEFGEDRVWDQVRAWRAARERLLQEQMDALLVRTTDKLRRWGGIAGTTVMQMLDEFGAPAPQKASVTPSNMGYPLDRWGVGVQWTRHYFDKKTVAEFAAQLEEIARADSDRLANEIQRALYTPTNNLTYVDYLDNSVVLPIRRLVNADSTAIPVAPDGTTFNGATHTHYLARVGALAASDITAVVDTVTEHYAAGQPRLYINKAQEAAVRGFTSNFKPLTSPMVEIRSTADQPTAGLGRLNMLSPNDRDIGLWDDKAIVTVKPWALANYLLAWMDGAPKPLAMRVPARGPSQGELRVEADQENYPLRAQFLAREFGIAVNERTAAAVLYVGGTSYVSPTIA